VVSFSVRFAFFWHILNLCAYRTKKRGEINPRENDERLAAMWLLRYVRYVRVWSLPAFSCTRVLSGIHADKVSSQGLSGPSFFFASPGLPKNSYAYFVKRRDAKTTGKKWTDERGVSRIG
jgi:hypothetical protein